MKLLDLSLTCLLQEIKPLIEGSYINKVQEISSDKFKLKLRTNEGTKNLFLFPNAVFFSDYKIEAKKQTSGFGAFLRKRIEGKKILSVKQHKTDRILEIELQDYFLFIELFLNGNIILADKNLEIISALRKEETKNRKISKKEKYFFPESGKLDPVEMQFNEFNAKFAELFMEKNNALHSIASAVDIAPIFLEEIFFRLKLSKEKLAEKELKNFFDEIKKMYSFKEKPFPVVIQKGTEKTILPFRPASIKDFAEVPSVNSALDDFYSKEFFSEKQPETKPKKLIALEHSFSQQLGSEKLLLDSAEENRKKGELIYANNLILQEIIDSMKKGFSKGLKEKEITEKINAFLKENNKRIEVISLSKNKLLLNFREN
ncbi:MAG: NFACT family protein [archaeon]